MCRQTEFTRFVFVYVCTVEQQQVLCGKLCCGEEEVSSLFFIADKRGCVTTFALLRSQFYTWCARKRIHTDSQRRTLSTSCLVPTPAVQLKEFEQKSSAVCQLPSDMENNNDLFLCIYSVIQFIIFCW